MNTTITWHDAVTKIDTTVPIRDVFLRSEVFTRARKHLALELPDGGRGAFRHACRLARTVDRIAALAARDGLRLQLSTTNQTDAPSAWDRYHGLGVLVRAITSDGQRIAWSVALRSCGDAAVVRLIWQNGASRLATLAWRRYYRADVLVRRASEHPFVEVVNGPAVRRAS